MNICSISITPHKKVRDRDFNKRFVTIRFNISSPSVIFDLSLYRIQHDQLKVKKEIDLMFLSFFFYDIALR